MKGVNPFTCCARLVPLVILALALPTLAGNSNRGTTEEARTMLHKAVEHYKSVGRTQAMADFTARKHPFASRDLYVICLDRNGSTIAHGAFPSELGVSGDAVTDLNGVGLATAARNVTASTGEGVVRYRWINPVTHALEIKTTFFARIGDDICGVGVYTP
jgi:signal transduction histidine kinase